MGLFKIRHIFLLVALVAFLFFPQSDVLAQSVALPELVTSVYKNIKNLHLNISLVAEGKPASAIVASAQYKTAAAMIQAAIEKRSGVKVPVIDETDARAATPFVSNLIILGNRSTSKTSQELYDRHYSLMDLMDAGGNIIKQGKVAGRPVDLLVLQNSEGESAIIITDAGEVSAFRPG